MKKLLLIFVLLVIFSGCQKEKPTVKPMLTSAAINKSLITKSLVTGASGSSQYCQLLYNGASGSYHVNVTLGVANETWDYTLVNLDNNSLDIDLGVHGSFYSFDYTFPDVDFQFQFTENTEVNSGEFFAAGPVFSIYSKPTDPPTGSECGAPLCRWHGIPHWPQRRSSPHCRARRPP